MMQLVFLLEEPSIREVLEVLVPPLVPEGTDVRYLVHQGKSDLERSLKIKLRHWQVPGARFVVIRDQDAADCVQTKRRLAELCGEAGRPDALVRIACHELEAWFLGDLVAVGKAFDLAALPGRQEEAKFRQPDRLANAKEELRKLVPGYQQIKGARAIAPHLEIPRNRSASFQHLVSGVRRVSGTG